MFEHSWIDLENFYCALSSFNRYLHKQSQLGENFHEMENFLGGYSAHHDFIYRVFVLSELT